MVDHLGTLDGFSIGGNVFLGFLPDPEATSDPAIAINDSPGEADTLSGDDYIEQPRCQIMGAGSDLTETSGLVDKALRTFTGMDSPGNPDAEGGELARGSAASEPEIEYSYIGFWTVIPPSYMERDDLNRHKIVATVRCQRSKET